METLSLFGMIDTHFFLVQSSADFHYSGKEPRDTVLICLSSDDVDKGRIQMNKVARNNLQVKLGDLVNVHQCLDIKYGKRVHILPFDDSIEGLSGNIFEVAPPSSTTIQVDWYQAASWCPLVWTTGYR